MTFEFTCVSGFGKSGSGACVSLLKEFEFIDGLENEFRITKDPYGLIDLEFSLLSDWEFVRHDRAINDFLAYCQMLGRDDGLFKKVGKGFSKKLNVDFVKESENYINQLTNFTYFGDTLLHRYRLSALESFIKRIRSKIGLSNEEPMYFSNPNSEIFLIETQKFIKNLFKNYANENSLKKVVLDQSVSPNNFFKSMSFFDTKKIIIVDRDPRDIFETMCRERRLLGADKKNTVEKYIVWHKTIREKFEFEKQNNVSNIKILELRFEDFFVNYEVSISKLIDFLEIDYNHELKGSRFNPKFMTDYVGIWKNNKDQKSMEKIQNEFPESCFNS